MIDIEIGEQLKHHLLNSRKLICGEFMLKKFYNYSVNLVKASGKNIVIVTPLMAALALSILYISIEFFKLNLASISIFILMMIRLIPVAQSLANQRTAIASAQPSLDHILDIITKKPIAQRT